MENATKALLIAAAVLVVLLIISLALMVVYSNSEITNESSSSLNSVDLYAHNNKFLTYLSDSASGANARALTKTILQHNASASSSTKFAVNEHQVYLNFYPQGKTKIVHKWKTTDLQTIYDKISLGRRYKIYITNCSSHKKRPLQWIFSLYIYKRTIIKIHCQMLCIMFNISVYFFMYLLFTLL